MEEDKFLPLNKIRRGKMLETRVSRYGRQILKARDERACKLNKI